MPYTIKRTGESRSFPQGDAFVAGATPGAEIVLHLGTPLQKDDSKAAILVELGTECLGVHTGEAAGTEGSNVLGFARYRNGSEEPSPLIELVRQPNSKPEAIAAAKALIAEIWGRAAEDARSITASAIAARRVSAEGQEGLKAFLEKRKPKWIEDTKG